MSIISYIEGIFAIDRQSQRKRIVKNCVDLLFDSYIGKERISPLETSIALNEVRKEVFDRLLEIKKTEENKIQNITFSLQNIQQNDTVKHESKTS